MGETPNRTAGSADETAGREIAIGIDVGGTKIAGALVDASGAGSVEVWRPHAGVDGDLLIDLIISTVDTLSKVAASRSARTVGVGVSIAGLVDGPRGVVVQAARLGLTNVPLGDRLTDATGLQVSVDNDANCTLRAILGDDEATAVLFAIGTGLGGAIAVDGTIAAGSAGLAAELGHLGAGDSGEQCVCGLHDCLETKASGSAIARIAGRRMGDSSVTSEHVLISAERGEAWARMILDDVGASLAHASAGLVSVLDPAVIYLSGSVGHAAGPTLIPTIERLLPELTPFGRYRSMPRIEVDQVGPGAAAIGAGLLSIRSPW